MPCNHAAVMPPFDPCRSSLRRVLACLCLWAVAGAAPAAPAACDDPASVRADFAMRDGLPQSLPSNRFNTWGPKPATYPRPEVPPACDGADWRRRRVVAVAMKYVGLAYRHHHVPGYDGGDGAGLDCSNFTAWVYNYGLGLRLDSEIGRQADTAGRKLAPGDALQPGDLLFIRTLDDRRISHVAIYLDPQHVIDDHGKGVAVRDFRGWYMNHLAFARRVID